MKNGKKQGLIIIGFGLIILSGIILYFSLSAPKVTVNSSETVDNFEYTEATEISHTLTETSKTPPKTQSSGSPSELTVSYPLNLNTCTVQELATLNGIGEQKANSIIEYREYLGGYTSVEQIKNIKGIGDKLYEKVSPYLTV